MTPGAEFLRLIRELRARAELLDGDDWTALKAGAVEEVGREEAGAVSGESACGGGVASKSPVEALARMAEEVLACRNCPLGGQRLHPAFGVGSPDADVMFIGEGPGFEEDRKGEPFVGKAGQLLDKILASIGLSRETVYIANIVKCHPMIDPAQPDKRGNDRPPTPEEMSACRGYLDRQIELIRPRFLVALGGVAAKALIGTETGIMKLRGKWHTYAPWDLPLLPTFHPAALLRNPEWKRDVWTDMKNLKSALENGDD